MEYNVYRKYVLSKINDRIIHVLDIGAHDTQWARTLQQILYDYQLEFFQIEGNNQHLSHLESFDQMYCLALVGDVDGETVTFHKSNYPDFTTGNSIFRELSAIYEHDTVETRQMYRLDTILHQASYDDIPFDIVKYDVQGSEKKALLGSERTLKRMTSGIIVIESALLPVNGGNAASLLDIQIVLESFGFTLVDVMGEHYLKTPTGCQLLQIDAVYVKRNHAILDDEERFSWPPVPG